MAEKKREVLRLDGHDVEITRPDKVLFPEDGITKGDLIHYYERVSSVMLPHLGGRPLALQRFPDGIDSSGFFQKAAAAYYPGWIKKVTVPKEGGTVRHVVCENAATLVYLANQACITLHPWLSRVEKLQYPDQMIFDLDPSIDDTRAVVDGAILLKSVLDDLELPSFLKATGSRGLHIVVPLDRKMDFDSVREFSRNVAKIVVSRDSGRFTMEQSKQKRGGRVFVDTNRNAYAQTAVAAYSVRVRNSAPVAVPLDWRELRKKNFRPDAFTIRNVFARLDRIDDPWQDFWKRPASLEKAGRKLAEGTLSRTA